MELVDTLSKALFILIGAGSVTRIIVCFIKMMGDCDEAEKYKKRIKHTILFCVLAAACWEVKELILYYFWIGGS